MAHLCYFDEQQEFDTWIHMLKQRASERSSMRTAAIQRIQKTRKVPAGWTCKEFWQYMKVHIQDPGIIALYMESRSAWTRSQQNGQRQFLVHWGDTYMFEKHIAVHEQHGYQPKTHVKCLVAVKLYGPVTKSPSKVEKGYMGAFVGAIRCHTPTYD